VPPDRLIDQRPAVVLAGERIGAWEGDLVVGRGNRSAIATRVDRRSRHVHLVALPHGHDATAVRDALIAALTHLPAASGSSNSVQRRHGIQRGRFAPGRRRVRRRPLPARLGPPRS
jgi:IS30 family transposase